MAFKGVRSFSPDCIVQHINFSFSDELKRGPHCSALACPSPPRNDPSPHWWHWPWWLLGWERGCPIIGSLRPIIIWSLSDYPQSTTSPMGRFQWREINFNDYGSQHTNPISNISQTRFDSGNCILSFRLKPIMQLLSYSVGLLAQVWKIYMRFQGGVAWYENWAGAMHSWNSRLTACFKLNSSLKPILNNFSNFCDISCILANSNVLF